MGAWLGKASLATISVLDTLSFLSIKIFRDFFTGAGILACVSLPITNNKARTKPLCLWD